jgi:hypothetical protein
MIIRNQVPLWAVGPVFAALLGCGAAPPTSAAHRLSPNGEIQMIQRDTALTESQKQLAIARVEAKR